jgi:Zn-dependent protease with chaperone function
MALDPRLRSPKERPLFLTAAVLSAIAWLAMLVSVVGILYGLLGGLFLLVFQSLYFAHVRSNGLRLSDKQLPDLYARCKAAVARLGLAEVPEIYVVQSHGVLNAFAARLFSRNFVILNSALIDSCHDDRQLDFVVGHEIGHLAAGHLKWRLVLAPAMFAPWLGPAYSRACEYTCDLCGLEVCGGLEPAARGLVVLAAGGKAAASADLEAYLLQRWETGGFWPAVVELGSSHPFLCKRVAALYEYVKPGSLKPVSRNPLAYPFAPFLGFAAAGGGAGGGLLVIAMIGILAAVAIPNFVKFQERVRQQAEQQQRQLRQPRPSRGSGAPADTGQGEDSAAR